MFDRIPLASPVDAGDLARFREVMAWLEGKGGRPRAEADPLDPFRLALPSSSRKLISIRIDPWMLQLAKAVAKRHHLDYQHVLRLWIEQGIRRSVVEGARRRRLGRTRRGRTS